MGFWTKLLLISALLIVFLGYPAKVLAHAVGQPPFFLINDQYAVWYDAALGSGFLNLPQDKAQQNYLINQVIHFKINKTDLQVPIAVADQTRFLWNFGDGTTFVGSEDDHSYTKPGSYILTITATYQKEQPTVIESAYLNILPNLNYLPPRAIFKINGRSIAAGLDNIYFVNASQPVQFDASESNSSGAIVKYLWDFGDGTTGSGKLVSHIYHDAPFSLFVILRVVDSNDFYLDNFANIASQGFDQQPLKQKATTPSTYQAVQNQDLQSKSWLDEINYQANLSAKTALNQFLTGKITSWLFLLVAGLAFLAGGIHALTPGHGKSVMAAYLVGKNGSSLVDVGLLAISITLTHTILIFSLGLVFLFLDRRHTIINILPTFQSLSSILVIFIALSFIWRGLKHHHHHEHEHLISQVAMRKRSVLFAGLTGGIIPCTDAFAILLLATGAGQLLLGLVLVTIFSFGLASTIVILGLALLVGKRVATKIETLGRLTERNAPFVTGVFLLAVALKSLLKI